MVQLSLDIKSNIGLVTQASLAVYPDSKILADLSSCQAILESNLLRKPSNLALNYNNLFGIKGKGTAGSVSLPTNEFVNGKMIRLNQDFASNLTLEDSFIQHKNLLDRPRYKPVRDSKTFEEAANQIRLCGYATDPDYSTSLMRIYNAYIK